MPDHLQSAEMAPPAAIRETVEEAPDMQVHERPAKRRKKDASDRTRVSRACDRCKRYGNRIPPPGLGTCTPQADLLLGRRPVVVEDNHALFVLVLGRVVNLPRRTQGAGRHQYCQILMEKYQY